MERKLKNIISGLLNSFISRNSDVNGYWSIGKLYSHMLNNNGSKISIDLLEKRITPIHTDFEDLIHQYNKIFKDKVRHKDLDLDKILNVKILLEKKHKVYNNPHELIPLICSIKCVCENRKILFYKVEFYSRSHNPKLEHKSCRN